MKVLERFYFMLAFLKIISRNFKVLRMFISIVHVLEHSKKICSGTEQENLLWNRARKFVLEHSK